MDFKKKQLNFKKFSETLQRGKQCDNYNYFAGKKVTANSISAPMTRLAADTKDVINM